MNTVAILGEPRTRLLTVSIMARFTVSQFSITVSDSKESAVTAVADVAKAAKVTEALGAV